MKFAENNRISQRQLYRQTVLTLLAPFLLCLPGEGGLLGKEGIAGILAACGILAVYVLLLLRMVPWYTDPVKNLGPFQGRAAGIFFVSYVILTGAYLLRLMEDLIPEMLAPGVSGTGIAFLSAAVCSFGTHKGMQRRGRMAEVSGGILLGGVLLMMALCLGQSGPEGFREMTEEALNGRRILSGCLQTLCAFSGISLLPFMLKDVEKRGKAGRTLILSIFTLGGIMAGMLLLLPAVLGLRRVKAEEYPVLPLLAGADLPGNVLARFDVLWMGLLLYSLLFALGSLFHYGCQITERSRLGSGRWWVPAAAFLASVSEYRATGIREFYGRYLLYFFLPGVSAPPGVHGVPRQEKMAEKGRGGMRGGTGLWTVSRRLRRGGTGKKDVSSGSGRGLRRAGLYPDIRDAGSSADHRAGQTGRRRKHSGTAYQREGFRGH